MMITLNTKKSAFLIISLGIIICIRAQQTKIDSLKREIANAKTDTSKIILFENLGQVYRDAKRMDSAVWSYKQALDINEKINYSLQKQSWNIAAIDYILFEMGDYLESLKYAVHHLELSRQLNAAGGQGAAYLVFGHDYREMGDYRNSLNNYFKAYNFWDIFHKQQHEPPDNTYTLLCIALTYLKMGKPDSALFYTNQRFKFATATSVGGLILLSERILGDIYLAKGNDEIALKYYNQYIPDYTKYKERNRDLGFVLNSMAGIFQKKEQYDSAKYYAKKALGNAEQFHDQQNIYAASQLLYVLNDSLKNESEALKYLKIAIAAKDSIASIEKIRQIQNLAYREQLREKEQAKADNEEKERIRFVIIVASAIILLASFLIWNRIRQLRLRYKAILEQKEGEKLKAKYEKQLLELEAKALRAQMNPHFIFNCLNSIKSLMQEQKTERGVTYLTTFSKLIRTLFNNADKKEITLYDEIETCKLYLQLEAMRFDSKFSYAVDIDESIDLKSVHVPALIIQPFIENAIWHGIMPKENTGHVSVGVARINGNIEITIDDNGIGRESSQQNKAKANIGHQSKGVNLTQSRLELDNLLQQRQAKLEIIDKRDENNISTGTTVIIRINEEIS